MKQMSQLERKNALGMDELVRMYIKEMKLGSGLNTQMVFAAWDSASGAAVYTIKRFYRAGKLYITLNSSVVRSQLYFQKDSILSKINAQLRADPLFTGDDSKFPFVSELILK